MKSESWTIQLHVLLFKEALHHCLWFLITTLPTLRSSTCHHLTFPCLYLNPQIPKLHEFTIVLTNKNGKFPMATWNFAAVHWSAWVQSSGTKLKSIFFSNSIFLESQFIKQRQYLLLYEFKETTILILILINVVTGAVYEHSKWKLAVMNDHRCLISKKWFGFLNSFVFIPIHLFCSYLWFHYDANLRVCIMYIV